MGKSMESWGGHRSLEVSNHPSWSHLVDRTLLDAGIIQRTWELCCSWPGLLRIEEAVRAKRPCNQFFVVYVCSHIVLNLLHTIMAYRC
jgi:hypothetical protein